MKYRFYGSDTKSVSPINEEFAFVKDQRHLYDLMSDIWCEHSCAPRYRKQWSPTNKTLGQCSITAFLVQDIFGGKVYGVPLPEGGYHCFNVIDDVTFDLTSEQFGDTKLDYEHVQEQFRDDHFSSSEKYERYLYIRGELLKRGR